MLDNLGKEAKAAAKAFAQARRDLEKSQTRAEPTPEIIDEQTGEVLQAAVQVEDRANIPVIHQDRSDGSHVFWLTPPQPDEGESEEGQAVYTVSIEFNGTFGGTRGALRGSPFRVTTAPVGTKENGKMQPGSKEGQARNAIAGTGSLQFEHMKNEVKSINMYIKQSSRNMGLAVKSGDIQTLLKVKSTMREVEAISEKMYERYTHLDSMCTYLLSNRAKTAFAAGVGGGSTAAAAAMAAGGSGSGSADGDKKDHKKGGKKKKGHHGLMSTKSDKSFVKNQMNASRESSIRFTDLQDTQCKKTRQRIKPIENKESAKVRASAIAFNNEMGVAVKKFHRTNQIPNEDPPRVFWLEEATVAAAEKALADARTELTSNKKKLVGWQKMVDVFDHEGIINQATEDIATMEATVLDMAKLWQIRKDVDAEAEASNSFVWDGLDPEDLEDASKKMVKLLRGLPRGVRKNPAFRALNNVVRIPVAVCVLMLFFLFK